MSQARLGENHRQAGLCAGRRSPRRAAGPAPAPRPRTARRAAAACVPAIRRAPSATSFCWPPESCSALRRAPNSRPRGSPDRRARAARARSPRRPGRQQDVLFDRQSPAPGAGPPACSRCRARAAVRRHAASVVAVEVERAVRRGSSPMMVRNSVVLPAPLRPIRPANSPAPTSRLTPRRIADRPDRDRDAVKPQHADLLADHVAAHSRHRAARCRRPVGDDAAVVERDHARGVARHDVHVVLDEEHRHAGGARTRPSRRP